MYVINRQPTVERAFASASRLGVKHGKGLFAVQEDREVGGDEFPYAVVAADSSYYDRKPACVCGEDPEHTCRARYGELVTQPSPVSEAPHHRGDGCSDGTDAQWYAHDHAITNC